MNLPNKLTLVRALLTPILLAVMTIDLKNNMAVALIIFVVASVTDWLDGQLARRKNMITTFGKFLDPIADKMLIFAAFLGFLHSDCVWRLEWVIFIAIARELLVASARMLAASDGNVIAADIWGKAKTVLQMIAVIAVMVFEQAKDMALVTADISSALYITGSVLMWLTAALTVFSGVNYLLACAKYVMKSK